MLQELNLHFKKSQQVTIQLVQDSSVTVDFAIPLTPQDREAIRHYLEVYAAQYVMDIDDLNLSIRPMIFAHHNRPTAGNFIFTVGIIA